MRELAFMVGMKVCDRDMKVYDGFENLYMAGGLERGFSKDFMRIMKVHDSVGISWKG